MYYLKASFIVFIITVLSCELFLPYEKSDSVKIYPRISFADNSNYSLDNVTSIEMRLIVKDSTMQRTFEFKDGEGDIGEVQIKTPFEIFIYGRDTNGKELFKGYVWNPGILNDTTIFIEVTTVTPLIPSDFKLEVLSDGKNIRFSWDDKSGNENGFYLTAKDSLNKIIYKKTINKNNVSIDIKKEDKNILYSIEAFNSAGSSYPLTIGWYWEDTLKLIENILKEPPGTHGNYIKDQSYQFQIEPVQIELYTCPLGHKLQYKFDFDDTVTDWINSRAYNYAWKTSGSKSIKFKIRCSENKYNETKWSPPKKTEVK